MHALRKLCPWEMAKVQIYKLPKGRRFPLNIEAPVTHRAAILLYNDNTVEIESEPLSGARQDGQCESRTVACVLACIRALEAIGSSCLEEGGQQRA